MNLFSELALLLGGITVFMLGLKYIGENIESLSSSALNGVIARLTNNRLSACIFGAAFSALAQSGTAINVLAISFFESGALNLIGAYALIIGTNIGTTMTAQLVALSFSSGFSVTAIGAVIALLGFVLSSALKGKGKLLANALMGFGLVFIGINIMSESAEAFKKYEWFQNVFLIKSAPILLLNGFFITAICQSSSVVTSMLVVLSASGAVELEACVYLIMGSNLGTCIPVILLSLRKNVEVQRVGWFNLIFNLAGIVVFAAFFALSGDFFFQLLLKTSPTVFGQIANFHTIFNVISGVVGLVFLNPLIGLMKMVVRPARPKPI